MSRLFQINTRCWLRRLSEEAGRTVHLDAVPETEWQAWKAGGFDWIWLMGIWSPSRRSREIAMQHPGVHSAFYAGLPGWKPEDVSGSPYAVGDYSVPASFGGEIALASFRKKLHERGFKLMLDFVPNHLGLDHPWVASYPERFVQSRQERPGTTLLQTNHGPRWMAHGKDPFFAPWTDTVQLDYRKKETHRAVTQLLLDTAAHCDGLRCDMSMLLLPDVFQKTWESFPGPQSTPEEFWPGALAALKKRHPGFTCVAEVYWGLETKLHEQGFDYCYDKETYDLVVQKEWAKLGHRLEKAPPQFLTHTVRFLENHDERRIASVLNFPLHAIAATLFTTGPGLTLIHQGQPEGWKKHVPVQLNRFPPEVADPQIQLFYRELFDALRPLPPTDLARFLHPVRGKVLGWQWENYASLVCVAEEPLALKIPDSTHLLYTYPSSGPRLAQSKLHMDPATACLLRLPTGQRIFI